MNQATQNEEPTGCHSILWAGNGHLAGKNGHWGNRKQAPPVFAFHPDKYQRVLFKDLKRGTNSYLMGQLDRADGRSVSPDQDVNPNNKPSRNLDRGSGGWCEDRFTARSTGP